MKRIILKVLLALFVVLLFGVPAFIFWMRAGEEKPLDYSAMDFELGPQDPEINGYTYLREFCEENEADIPDNYPYDFNRDIEYSLYENWDLEFFEQILEANKEFMAGIEAAFDRPVFMLDRELSPQTMSFHLGQLRSYVTLRVLEARVLYLSGQHDEALQKLSNFAEELEIYMKSGDSLIGLLTSVAMNGILTAELWEFQAHAKFSSEALKAIAEGYDVAEYYSTAASLAMRQEFQFFDNIVDYVSQDGARVSELISYEEPSLWTGFLQDVALYVGLRKDRTINDMFEAYLDVVEQAHLPVSERSYENMWQTKSHQGWGVLLNRNPVGHVLVSILHPSVSSIFERVDRGEASASATRISFALQAYYLENKTLPESLATLVPDYIAAIPRDPFDGERMRYSKEKKIVYSVGNDFVDQGGSEKPFIFQMDPDDNYEAAEHDDTEPTFPLRFGI